MAVGVAKPRAHGQATTSTATPAAMPVAALAPASIQPMKAAAAAAMTAGTKTALARSTSRCTGARDCSASSSNRMIWAWAVSAPTLWASTVKSPVVFSVAPVTSSPGCTASGIGSPVRKDLSIAECPDTTMPSAAMRSPGRTTKRIPAARSSMAMSVPSSRRAVVTLSSASEATASCDLAWARLSSHPPSRTKTMIVEAIVKWMSPLLSEVVAHIDQPHATSTPSDMSVFMLGERAGMLAHPSCRIGHPTPHTTAVESAPKSQS